jgi:Nodulin-like
MMAHHTQTERQYINKWATFAACSVVQLTAGLPYTFGIFSSQFKSKFQWSQGELTGLGAALHIGAFSAFIPGILYNALAEHRFGPRCVSPGQCYLIAR